MQEHRYDVPFGKINRISFNLEPEQLTDDTFSAVDQKGRYEAASHSRGGRRRTGGPDLVYKSPHRDTAVLRHGKRRRGCLDESNCRHCPDRFRSGLLAGWQHVPRVLSNADIQCARNPVSHSRRTQQRSGGSAVARCCGSRRPFCTSRSRLAERTTSTRIRQVSGLRCMRLLVSGSERKKSKVATLPRDTTKNSEYKSISLPTFAPRFRLLTPTPVHFDSF
jgi:hypothetical protein